ncbi:hypothetical protein GCM10027347_59590 [Larkinella harenae]
MNDAQTILRMIETVDPAHTGILDVIDAKVTFYLKGLSLRRRNLGDETPAIAAITFESSEFRNYTRSRDVLKAIRPQGCYIRVGHDGEGPDPDLFICEMLYNLAEPAIKTPPFPTEELAELHAIIQAIAYERSQAGGQ